MLAIGMDVHSSKTTAYAVPLDESDLDMRAIADDFNRCFKRFHNDLLDEIVAFDTLIDPYLIIYDVGDICYQNIVAVERTTL